MNTALAVKMVSQAADYAARYAANVIVLYSAPQTEEIHRAFLALPARTPVVETGVTDNVKVGEGSVTVASLDQTPPTKKPYVLFCTCWGEMVGTHKNLEEWSKHATTMVDPLGS